MLNGRCVLQDWVIQLTMMQQTVLLTAIRGPDGVPKYNPVKLLWRWYRRCVLLSVMDGRVIIDPVRQLGGSFTGPSVMGEDCSMEEPADGSPIWAIAMNKIVDTYLREIDGLPHHCHMHLMHAVEILGYKHPDAKIRKWWNTVYLRFTKDMHLQPETEADLDERLGDTRDGWQKHADPATRS